MSVLVHKVDGNDNEGVVEFELLSCGHELELDVDRDLVTHEPTTRLEGRFYLNSCAVAMGVRLDREYRPTTSKTVVVD